MSGAEVFPDDVAARSPRIGETSHALMPSVGILVAVRPIRCLPKHRCFMQDQRDKEHTDERA
jgi:hypothetical protein